MKKSISVLFLILAFCLPIDSIAFHMIGEKAETKILLKTEFMSPEKGDSYIKYRTAVHFQKGDLGLGGEVLAMPEYDYLRFRPYATIKIGPVTPIIGLSTDSKGADHLNAGIWYSRKVSKTISLFLDLRNFWGLNDKTVDFTDNSLSLALNLNERIFTGLDLAYDYYWKSKDDWYLIGVPIGYNITKDITVFVRPTFERYLPEKGKSSDTYSFRIGMNIKL